MAAIVREFPVYAFWKQGSSESKWLCADCAEAALPEGVELPLYPGSGSRWISGGVWHVVDRKAPGFFDSGVVCEGGCERWLNR